ncbi:hypothetical protein ACJIZ3_003599 [Penstemon smallii]|uniref:DNA polymerase delta small subunit n=1 Tax=Penstemon smallii TaxID=265156 RepID=A0ABD3UBQ5_9LAMI
MKLKPSVLDEYSKERSVTPLVRPHNFTHSDDYLVLEDESGRVKLRGTLLLPSVYVTGIVVALHGKETGAGDFMEQGIAAQIVQVVVVGNSVENPRGLFNGQNLGTKDQSKLSEPIKELDILLSQVIIFHTIIYFIKMTLMAITTFNILIDLQIAASIPLDIMPGTSDPANFALPQQPLHRCLFPGSSAYNTFRSCTNPHSFELDNVKFLGTSGQNIDDLEKYSDAKDKLEFVERTLKWRHIAPTAPNTLGCYPFTDRDPFFLETCPHVYFVGNQDKYETRFIKGTLS